MHILLTNDDGIHAPGLLALVEGLRGEHELSVIAPEQEQSAVGHAITLLQPIRVKSISLCSGIRGLAVTGTPADCVKIGVAEVLSAPPDLIISGINLGANVGIDALYSGTVSAATEGAILGVPSMAVSLDTFSDPDFEPAVAFIKGFVHQISERPFPPSTALNINVPAIPLSRIGGVTATRHGSSRCSERFDRRVDPRGNVYYWQAGGSPVLDENGGSDREALDQGKISITPIQYDLTNYPVLEELKRWKIHVGTM
ncbi:MAG: 5'/3'-nucleotidase SurE [Deltaproteobacteria bacterium]|nr:5'/3'-nucleotidase SurE [Deltaproteobacteria bacterium]